MNSFEIQCITDWVQIDKAVLSTKTQLQMDKTNDFYVKTGMTQASKVAPSTLCALSRFFHLTVVLIVTTFATVPTGNGTPEMIRMGHSFPIFSVLLSFQLQHTTTAIVAVRGMTGSSLVIDKFTVEEWGCTGFRFNLTHGTQVTPSFATTLVGVSRIFRPFSFAKIWGRGGTSTQVSLEEFFNMGVILPLKGQFDEQFHQIILRMGRTLPL